jgi:hypothetical protein
LLEVHDVSTKPTASPAAAVGAVDPARLRRRLDALRGAAGDGAARALVAGWLGEAGLRTWTDPAGSLRSRLHHDRPEASAVLTGSHCTTAQQGGWAGALGLVGAVEALTALAEAGALPARPVGLVAFAAGSHLAMTGLGAGRVHAFAGIEPDPGATLERLGLAVGVATAIAGTRLTEFTVTAGAGRPSPSERPDALAAAAEMILGAERVTKAVPGGELLATVRRLATVAGDAGPGRVCFDLDLRSAVGWMLADAAQVVEMAFDSIAERRGVALAGRRLRERTPVAMAPEVRAAAIAAASEYGLAAPDVTCSGPSGVAGAMAAVAPAGLVLVRNRGGHAGPPEVAWDDAAAGVRVLTATLLRLADDGPTIRA